MRLRWIERLAIVGLVFTLACSGSGAGPDADVTEWQSERVEEGSTTIVRTLAGSKWGAPGVLVEELSIGVLEGAEEYMLGRVSAVAADDAHVFVMDSQPAQLKVFDRATGEFIRYIGQEGEGPGEYQFPLVMRVVGDEIFVQDGANGRISVFGIDGEYRYLLRIGSDLFGAGFVVTADGRAYVQTGQFLDDGGERLPTSEQRVGLQEVGPDGAIGDPFLAPAPNRDLEDAFMIDAARQIGTGIPFMPGVPAGLATAPAIVTGVNDQYRLGIYFPDGRSVLVERRWDPVPMSDAEREHHRALVTSRMRTRLPNWEWTGAAIPEHKPAYASIMPDHGSQILVVRYLPSERGVDCVEAPIVADLQQRPAPEMCWATRYAWDFFDFDGNYLGEVIRPDVRILGFPYMRDRTFVIPVDDDDGAVRVKVFHLQLPTDVPNS
jgi:hypothetical protein